MFYPWKSHPPLVFPEHHKHLTDPFSKQELPPNMLRMACHVSCTGDPETKTTSSVVDSGSLQDNQCGSLCAHS